MPLQKVQFKPGVDRETTRYSSEGGWYDTDKVRFRSGFPEKIGGWEKVSNATYLGVCRSLWSWCTHDDTALIGVGTNLKFYISKGGAYYDVTPIRATASLTDPFDTTDGLTTVTVHDTAHGCVTGSYVTFSGASAVGGLTLNAEYAVTVVDDDTYTITAASPATSTVTGGGGSVTAAYQLNIGNAIQVPLEGFGAGTWGAGAWNGQNETASPLRLWSQYNFGEDLVFASAGGGIYYWDATSGTGSRAVALSSLGGAADVPTIVSSVFVSDVNRFVIAFGCNEIGGSMQDPMLIRWSDQEDAAMWTPTATNQAGSLRLSHGCEIAAVVQARQEILVWTNVSLYSLQYLGSPEVWGAQLLGDGISIASSNATIYAGNVAFWMGKNGFYMYDGSVRPLPSGLRRYVFNDFNTYQYEQVFAGVNGSFNEVWWFYCSANATTVDRYVVYNYVDNIWYPGTMARTAWLDTVLPTKTLPTSYPIAATYSNNLVLHEKGVDDNETATTRAISAHASSSDFDLDDGHTFMLVNRMLPDITFDGSTADSPAVTMTLMPMSNSGSGYNSPLSEGGNSANAVTRSATVPIEQYTGQVYVRIRGRQLAFKVASSELGVMWQLGTPRLDMKRSGRRGA